MLNIGWSEMLVIAAVLILVVGPREMPRVLYALSKHLRRARGAADDFRRSIEEAVKDVEVEEAKRELAETYAAFDRDFDAANPGARSDRPKGGATPAARPSTPAAPGHSTRSEDGKAGALPAGGPSTRSDDGAAGAPPAGGPPAAGHSTRSDGGEAGAEAGQGAKTESTAGAGQGAAGPKADSGGAEPKADSAAEPMAAASR